MHSIRTREKQVMHWLGTWNMQNSRWKHSPSLYGMKNHVLWLHRLELGFNVQQSFVTGCQPVTERENQYVASTRTGSIVYQTPNVDLFGSKVMWYFEIALRVQVSYICPFAVYRSSSSSSSLSPSSSSSSVFVALIVVANFLSLFIWRVQPGFSDPGARSNFVRFSQISSTRF